MGERKTTLILFALISFPVFGHSESLLNLNNNTDKLSLLDFKSHISFDPFGALETWNFTSHFCNWKGVTCNSHKQRVTTLNLQHFGLVGTISPYFSNLSFLSYLNLENNSFRGYLPREIGKLFRLKNLTLSSNQLEGTIPASLSSCSRLVDIDLSGNKFEGVIPPELGSLSGLTSLLLKDNFLTGQIPSSFQNLSSMNFLILTSNHLQGSIPNRLGQLPFLSNLQLSINNLTGEIPGSLFNRSSLTILSLAVNKLSGNLPSEMFYKLAKLTFLSLGDNRLSGPIPVSLANASQLNRVDLSQNNFTGKVPTLGNLADIEFLNLYTNKLESNGPGGFDFLTSLSNSTKLEILSVGSNHLSGKIPSSIGNLSRQLFALVLGDNRLEGSLPEEISNLVGLTLLSLEFNSFTGKIPPWIGKLPQLQMLYLHKNKFSGEIPGSLGNLTLLSEMSLMYNQLTGTIPPSLGNFRHIETLALAFNMLSGTIPREIFSSRSFSSLLDISWNNLSGSLPEEIGQLKMILSVDASGNKLAGEIPHSIGDCSSLEYLNLSQNSFYGPIPKSLSNLKGVKVIDFSSNNLSGEIPISLNSLQFLQILDLSNNQLKGEVPQGEIFNNTTIVSLGRNPLLCGGISQFHLPTCPVAVTKKHSRVLKVKLLIGLASGLVALLIVSLILLLFLRNKSARTPAVDNNRVQVGFHKLYTHRELKIATRNFSQENFIGEGSFGTVYKGTGSGGEVLAIKVFKMGQHKASKTFLLECEALRRIRHRNLVKTVSVCSTDDFKALVLQFMPNGSLDEWLHRRNGQKETGLDMKRRLEIAQDVASAIEYLHHDCETPIVHCDLKPSNVLLDDNMCAHVSDFGLARVLLGVNNGTASSTIGLKGSIGYISPEYGMGGEVSTKGDIYSFGIVMLEMFTNKRPTDEIFSDDMDLQRFVSMGLPHRVMDIVDRSLLEQEPKALSSGCIFEVLEIGLKCAAKSPEIRPSMREASMMIKNVTTKFLN